MGNCVVHIMGSDNKVDMLTEERLGVSLHQRLIAISATYGGLAAWEAAYIADIKGDMDSAISEYDRSIAGITAAIGEWKKAEFAQSELIAYFTSLPSELALRVSVADALKQIDFRSHVSNITRQGRFPVSIDTNGLNSMVELGCRMFEIDDRRAVSFVGDDSLAEIVSMFGIDLHQIRQLKLKAKETLKTLEENRHDVTRAQLFERVGSALSIDKELYPLMTVTAQLRVGIVNYVSYLEAYGSYVTQALIEAKNDDTWAHVKAFIDA